MSTEYENRFDCEDLLRLENAESPKGTATSIQDDHEIILSWSVPSGAGTECISWLKSNRLVASDFDTKFRNFQGTWRTTSIRADDKGGRDGTVISVTMSKGYYESLDWNTARIIESSATAGNSSSAKNASNVAISGTSSDSPRNVFIARLPYIHPANANAIAISVAELETINFSSNPIQGISSGTYNVISASVKREEDQYCSVIVVFALPQYTIESYDNVYAIGESTITYLWKVPESQAQTIIDAWKSSHPQRLASASASYEEGYVNVTLRRLTHAYLTALDWTTARIYDSSSTPGNTSSAKDSSNNSISNTTSNNPRNIVQVRLPWINPANANSIALSVVQLGTLDCSTAGIPDLTSGTYRIISASVMREEEVYCSVVVTLALPQYTIEAYTDFGGLDQSEVIYLWRVPEALAQGVINAWKVAYPVSSSASADYQEGGLVNIILRRKANTPDNLSIEGINLTCDTIANYHFAWGYEEGSISAFISAHNTTPAGATHGMAGVTREVSVQTRGDGLFDIIIKETIKVFDAGKHIFELETFTGSDITQDQRWGWNVPLSELATYESDYAAAAAAVNKRSEFTISRKDDCTFDFRGVVETYSKIEMSAATTGVDGVKLQLNTGRYAAQADVSAAMPASGPRKRIQISLDQNELGSASYAVIINEVKETQDEQFSDGGRKIYQHFKNADVQPSSPGANYRMRGVSVGANDDATLDGNVLWHDVSELSGSKDFGNGRKLYYGQWADDIPSGGASEKFQTGRVDIDEDGKFQYNLWFKSTASAPSATWNDGTSLFTKSNVVKVNDDPSNVPSPSTADGVTEEISAQIDPEEGTARWQRQTTTAVDSNDVGAYVMRRNGFVSETVTKRRNSSIANLPTLDAGQRGEIEFEILETKRLNWIKRTLEMNSELGTLRTSSERERIVYDADHIKHNSSVSARYKDPSSGHGWETKITSFLMGDVPITRKRSEWTTVEEEYSLSPLSADAVVSPDGGNGGEQTSVVDIVGDGIWRRTKTTVEYGAWENVNSYITLQSYAADLTETSTF